MILNSESSISRLLYDKAPTKTRADPSLGRPWFRSVR
jgi:hypothetical protein